MRLTSDAKQRGLQRSMLVWASAGIAVLLAAFVGCGRTPAEPSGKVAGKVTLQGKPFELGAVVFVKPDGVPADSAELTSTGEFQFSDAIPVGQYRVAIGLPKEDAPAGAPTPRLDAALKVLPPKYRNAATSGLTADVKEGDNAFTFEMQ